MSVPSIRGMQSDVRIVLERTTQIAKTESLPDRSDESVLRSDPGGIRHRAWEFFVDLSFSSLTRRIVFLNLTGLIALVIGILYLSQFRAGLIGARIESLLVQGEIIAASIAASATVDPDSITIDPERLLDLQPGETYDPSDDTMLDFSINPERVGPFLRKMVTPTNTRARVYDRDGDLLLDSRTLYDVVRMDLPPPDAAQPNYFERRWMVFRRWLAKGELPSNRKAAGKDYQEIRRSLIGLKAHIFHTKKRDEVISILGGPVHRK